MRCPAKAGRRLPTRLARRSAMQRHTRDVDGEQLAWHESGDGTPVVLVHGIPTGPRLWRNVTALVHDARCLAFEMLGYADSIPYGVGRDISVAAQAARLWRWLDALEVERAVLAGHDDARVGSESAALHWQPYRDHGGAAAFVRQVRSLRTADTLAVADQLK